MNIALREVTQEWIGRVTAPENIRWFIPIWPWFAAVVWIVLRGSLSGILIVTSFFVFFASGVPFFYRRVGLIRWWVFARAIPAILAAVVTQCFRSFSISRKLTGQYDVRA